MPETYDIKALKKEIIEHLETEGYLMPAVYAEIEETDKSVDPEFILSKAIKLGISINKYKR